MSTDRTATREPDPYGTFRYIVELETAVPTEFETVEFSEVAGLEVSREVEEYAEGGRNYATHKLPGRVSHGNLTLKRGVTTSTTLWDWLEQTSGMVEGGKLLRRTVRVVLLDRLGTEVRSWTVRRAYPVKWSGPTMTAGSNDLAIESLELAHEGITSEEHDG